MKDGNPSSGIPGIQAGDGKAGFYMYRIRRKRTTVAAERAFDSNGAEGMEFKSYGQAR